MPAYSDQASEIKEVQLIADSALAFFDSLVQCADQEGQEIVSMLAQLVLNFSTLSDEIDDDKRMNYGKLCVGVIVNKILKDHRERGVSSHSVSGRCWMLSCLLPWRSCFT